MNKRQIALARLAEREVQTIQGSCGIFTQYYEEMPEGSALRKIELELNAMDIKARRLQVKLEKLLKPYAEIEVDEIY
jgi:hypothetical protein